MFGGYAFAALPFAAIALLSLSIGEIASRGTILTTAPRQVTLRNRDQQLALLTDHYRATILKTK